MCTNIAEVKTFDKKVIRCNTNVPMDVECMALFFATSLHRAWAKLELHGLYPGLRISYFIQKSE